MRPLICLLLVAGCTSRPELSWPEGAQPERPGLVPLAEVQAGAVTSEDPGPAVTARGDALRAWVAGLAL